MMCPRHPPPVRAGSRSSPNRSPCVAFLLVYFLAQRYDDFRNDMGRWVKNGDVITRDHITEGFESTPQAFIYRTSPPVSTLFGKEIVAI